MPSNVGKLNTVVIRQNQARRIDDRTRAGADLLRGVVDNQNFERWQASDLEFGLSRKPVACDAPLANPPRSTAAIIATQLANPRIGLTNVFLSRILRRRSPGFHEVRRSACRSPNVALSAE